MSVTKEQVQEEVKKLGITLTEDLINAHVLLGKLPIKEEEKKEEEEEKDKGSKGEQARIRQLVKEKNDAKKLAADALKKLQEKQDAEDKAKKEKLEADGKHKELAEAEAKKAELAEKKAEAAKNSLKDTAIRQRIEVSLLSEGVPADRLTKALKLFDVSGVDFEWEDENELTYKIGDVSEIITEFKKDNAFMFDKSDDDDDDKSKPNKYDPHKSPKAKTLKEKDVERLKKNFSALR